MAVSSVSGTATARPAGALSPHTRRVALIVSGAFFIEQLDTTIITTAIPEIAHALRTDPLFLNLTITAYMLGLSVIVPISGWIADRFGARRVFAASIGLFIVASLLCGLAPNAMVLIVARFIQGLAGALMTPVGRLIVVRTASRRELVEAMALVMVPAMIAPLVGPAVGGVIVTWFDWRWIFFINIPLGLLAIPSVIRVLPEEPGARGRGIDRLGAVLVALSFASAALAFEGLSGRGIGPAFAVGLLLIGLITTLLYVAHARRHAAPIVDLRLLRLPNFRASMLAGSVYRVAVGGVPFLLPLALQLAHGVPALASGFIVLLPAVGGLAMKFFSTALLRHHGYRVNFLAHGLLSALFLAALAASGGLVPWWLAIAVLVGFGLSRSLLMNAYGTIAYAEVSRDQMASATSFFLAVQTLTTGLGVAFAALAADLTRQLLPQATEATHFSIAFAALSLCALVSVALSLLFDAEAGSALIRAPCASPQSTTHSDK